MPQRNSQEAPVQKPLVAVEFSDGTRSNFKLRSPDGFPIDPDKIESTINEIREDYGDAAIITIK